MIIQNSDNVVIYNNDWALLEDGAYNAKRNIRDKSANTGNCIYIDMDEPADFERGNYTYDGEYHLTGSGLEAAKAIKKTDLDTVFAEKGERPIVDTGLGFNAQGGYRDIENIKTGIKLLSVKFRDELNVTHPVATEQLQDILDLIEINGAAIMNNKWTLADAITAATTEAELNAININEGW